MNENEKNMEMEQNPYDALIKEERLEPAIVLKPSQQLSEPEQIEKAVEIKPLADQAIYSKLKRKEKREDQRFHFTVEEDLLVPDTEPDMEIIYNVEGCTKNIHIEDNNIHGTASLETMYLPGKDHNDRVVILESTIDFKKELEQDGDVNVHCKIRQIDFRVINERKYKVILQLEVIVELIEEQEYQLFNGIKDEELEVKKEKIQFTNLVATKTKETEISENVSINDEKIRPVKILKASFTIAENHRQLTREKLILNDTIWVRIIYMAEVAYQGNLANNVMYYQGKIDCTQFLLLDDENEISCSKVDYDISGLTADINTAGNGFCIEGIVRTKADLYGITEKEIITDFFHKKEDFIYDRQEQMISSGMNFEMQTIEVQEKIALQSDGELPSRILYESGHMIESKLDENTIKGKLQIEVLLITENGRTISARKNAEFTASTKKKNVELNAIMIREIQSEISSSGNIVFTVQIQASLYQEYENTLTLISNPCLVRDDKQKNNYPIIICTAKAGDTVWDIAKKYKVPPENITKLNNVENIVEGMRLVIAK